MTFPKHIEYKVVMIPTETGVIIKTEEGLDTCFNHGFDLYNPENNYKHVFLRSLYFTTNQKIEKGDWYLSLVDDESYEQIFQYDGSLSEEVIEENGLFDSCFKIVASTDKSLNLPIIPESFVKRYVVTGINKVKLSFKTNEKNEVVIFENLEQGKYRVGRNKGIAILETSTGKEHLLFKPGQEKATKEYCEYLNLKSSITERYNKKDFIKFINDYWPE